MTRVKPFSAVSGLRLRFYIEPNTPDPLVKLGRFVRNFKRWTKSKCEAIGVTFEWEPNYHDRICRSREIIDLADKYIANNPLKWALMHGTPPPLKVVEPIESPRFEPGEWWSGVGTFISPCERALFDALVSGGYPIIKAIPDPLAMVYRPKGDEPRLFAENRLLYLSRVVASDASRYDAWHSINDALSGVADLKGRLSGRESPTSLYVLPRDPSGRSGLEWRFS